MKSDLAVKAKIKINMNMPTEHLLNNIIDKDFQAVLLPLRIIQSFFLIFKFRIINNFITPESNASFYIKSALGLTILLLTCYVRFLINSLYAQHFESAAVLKLFAYFDLLYWSLVSIMMYIDSALNRNHVVELVIKQQKILNSFEVDKKAFFLKHRFQTWFCFFSLFSIYLTLVLVSSYDVGFVNFLVSFITTVSTLIFDVNIVDVTRSVVMIKNLLVAWSHAMQQYTTDNIQTMFHAYVDIITAFRLCNKVNKFSFTYFAVHIFIFILCTLKIGIEVADSSSEESHFQYWRFYLFLALWNIKNITLIATLSIACENFYRTVKLAESDCVQILNDDQAAGMYKTCKNVIRLNRAVMLKLTAFGVFEADAAFLLRLLSGLVTYTVVILQVAFL